MPDYSRCPTCRSPLTADGCPTCDAGVMRAEKVETPSSCLYGYGSKCALLRDNCGAIIGPCGWLERPADCPVYEPVIETPPCPTCATMARELEQARAARRIAEGKRDEATAALSRALDVAEKAWRRLTSRRGPERVEDDERAHELPQILDAIRALLLDAGRIDANGLFIGSETP